MKKRLLGLILALTCLLLPILTSCGDGEEYKATAKVKPMTVTLYGIKGEGTTDEAILKVQNKLNEYTEGNLSTRVLLRLFTEDEYYEKLDEAIEKAQKYKEEQKNNKKNNKTTTAEETKAPDGTGDDKDDKKDSEKFELQFDDEKGTQVDIFMVRGTEKLTEYVDRKLATSVKVAERSSLMGKYISSRYLALASTGNPIGGGELEKTTLYGIPCNYVVGDYTYLLVNKEIADNYGYAEKNLDTLDELSLFLNDAAKDYSDYVTLYNAPELAYGTMSNTLIGAALPNDVNAFTFLDRKPVFTDTAYVNFYKNLNLFENKGYITEGDSHALPEDGKVAAAFIKGNAALPEKYADDYYVLTYQKPVVEDIGTVFCVSSLAANSSRCLEVVNALMTNKDYRNTFQYGVENEHYKVNDYTGELEVMDGGYNMNYADTGNMFILEPNTSMSPEMLALAENDWALAKQQYRDAVVNPFTAPYMKFNLTYYDETNFVSSGWYKGAYIENMTAIVSEFDDYKTGLEKALAEAQAEIDKENEKNKNKEDYVEKTLDVEKETAEYTESYIADFEKYGDGRWYKSVLNGKVESDIETLLKDTKAFADAYEKAKKEAEGKGETFDETKWYKTVLAGKTTYSMIEVVVDKKDYSDALKAAKKAAEADKEKFDEAKFRDEYKVKTNIKGIFEDLAKDIKAAEDEAKKENKTFDVNAFLAEYAKPMIEDINKKYTFAYAPGYTAGHMEAVEALTAEYLERLMDYTVGSELTFEEHAAALAAEYAEEEEVKLMLDPEYADSITAQFTAWAKKMGYISDK